MQWKANDILDISASGFLCAIRGTSLIPQKLFYRKQFIKPHNLSRDMNIDVFTLTSPGAAENCICHDLMGITCCTATGDRSLIKAKLIKYLSHYKKMFCFKCPKEPLACFHWWRREGNSGLQDKT